MINYINSEISECYLGNNKLDSVYLGSTKLWPTTIDYSKEYLTIESLEDSNTITFGSYKGSYNYSYSCTVSYSTDKINWTSITVTASGSYYSSATKRQTITTLNIGDKLYIKGTNTSMATNDSNYFSILSNKKINVSGNVMSVLYNDNFIEQTSLTSNYALCQLFYDSNNSNRNIVDASNLILPATTLSDYCYYRMFDTQENLIAAPVLPATTLTASCYYQMFRGCTSLVTAPVLPATTLTASCYYQMFRECTSLNYIKAMFTTTPSSTYTGYWVTGVAATGQFVKNSSATWINSFGESAIPTGWTVTTASS